VAHNTRIYTTWLFGFADVKLTFKTLRRHSGWNWLESSSSPIECPTTLGPSCASVLARAN